MAVQTQVVRFQKITVGGNGATQDVNLSFTPKAIFLFSEGSTSDDTFTDSYQRIQGISDGTNHACIASVSQDNSASSNTGNIHRDDSVFVRLDETAPTTVLSRASCSFATNKVIFTWDLLDASATYITIKAIGGSHIVNTKVNTVDIGTTSTGNVDFTGLGFDPTEPNAALFTMAGDATTTNTATDHASVSIGCAISSTQRTVNGHVSEDARSTMDTWNYISSTSCLANLDATTGSIDYEADFVSWITDGFRLNIINAASSTTEKFSYLVIEGGTWDTGIDTTPTSTGDKSTAVSVNSETIKGLFVFGSVSTTTGSVITNNYTSIGISDGTNTGYVGVRDADNAATSITVRRNSITGRILGLISSSATASSSSFFLEGSFSSFGTNQFTINHTTVSGTTAFNYIWVVVADGATFTLFERTLTEPSISVGAGTANRMLSANRTINEPSISVNETIDRQLSAFRTIEEDPILVNEVATGNILYDTIISEAAINVNETVARQLSANRSIFENILVNETLNSVLSAFRTLSEPSISVNETVERTKIVPRTISEPSISVNETLERSTFNFRTISEPSISVNETLENIKTLIRIITEPAISVNDTLERTRIVPRLIEESISVAETLARATFNFRTLEEPSISVSETVETDETKTVTLIEPPILVNETLERSIFAFRIITEPNVLVSEAVTVFTPIPQLAEVITDPGYTNPARVRITFKSKKGDTDADEGGDQVIYYRYDSYVPEDKPFNIINFNLRLVQGEIGVASLDIEDSRERIDDPRKIFYKSIVEIDFKKELGRDWKRMMTGIVRRKRILRPAHNALVYRITILSKQAIYLERVANLKRAAKRTAIDSSIPLSTDSKMLANNLFKEFHTATDILPLKGPTIKDTGEFDLDTGSISDEVTDFIAEIAPGLGPSSEIPTVLSEVTGAIWGVDEFGNPFFRYPTEKHSGIIIKDNPNNEDSAVNTSVNMDSFEFEDAIDIAEGFANRLYVLNSKDTSSTASSSKGSGKTSLTTRWIAQSFIATDNNITGAAFILSKTGNPTNSSGTIKGLLRANSGTQDFPTGTSLASFEISITQITSSASVIFVNDIKHPQGAIVPGQRYWWVLQGTGLHDDSHTVNWHHDNDLVTPNRISARLPLVDTDPTKPGNQLLWQRSMTGPVYAFSTFSSINHILTQSDSESIREFGLIESVVNLPAFDDDATFQKALVKILQTSAKLKRIYDYTRVTIPTDRFFLPGELVTVIDSKAKLNVEKTVNAEIVEVSYNFDVGDNAIGVKYCDLRMIGFVDPVIENYLDTREC